MTTRICKFGCGCLLSGFDEQARKYIEAGTGGLHTKERCEEAKAKLEQKNDHGNENQYSTPTVKGWIPTKEQAEKIALETKNYVDHTQSAKGLQQFKVFSNTSADVLTKEGNDWIKEQEGKKQVKLIGQLQYDNGTFAITVYYEETRQ